MIDKNGKLWGRVSVIDIVIVLAVLALGIGFAYRQTSPRLAQIIGPGEGFYITVESNRLRRVNVDAVSVGDVMFRLDNRNPMGTVVGIDIAPATEIMRRTDGTAAEVKMEGRYLITITLEAAGSITDVGYFVNGTDHIAPGSEIVLVSNRVYLPVARVRSIDRER